MTIDGKKITTKSKEIENFCILKVTAGTNCPQGGDSGYGGRTVLVLEDMGGTDMRPPQFSVDRMGASKVTLVFGGDSEAEVLIKALEFATAQLRRQLRKNGTPKVLVSSAMKEQSR